MGGGHRLEMQVSDQRPRRIPNDELEHVENRVTAQGGVVRQLTGSGYGLRTSIMLSEIPPGIGPRRHRHPHAEIFVVREGEVRYEVDDARLDASAGDLVIVPAEAWHTFTNTGDASLRLVVIHESERPTTFFEDGTSRD